jgi:hypothetical protein
VSVMSTTDIGPNSPEHWRSRAGDTRRLADQMTDAVAKQTLLAIAQSYEQLAALAEERTVDKPG